MTDDYIILSGGCVQNTPSLPMFDLDNLEDGDPDYIVPMLEDAREHGIDWLIKECEDALASIKEKANG